MDLAPAAAEAAVEAGAVVEVACVQQYAAAAAWVRQQAACVFAAAGSGSRGNDCDGRHAASVHAAVGSGYGCMQQRAAAAACVWQRAGAAGAGLQWDTVMAAASQRHKCDGQWRRRRRKGRWDGGKIVMNNDYSDGQLWVNAGIGGRSG